MQPTTEDYCCSDPTLQPLSSPPPGILPVARSAACAPRPRHHQRLERLYVIHLQPLHWSHDISCIACGIAHITAINRPRHARECKYGLRKRKGYRTHLRAAPPCCAMPRMALLPSQKPYLICWESHQFLLRCKNISIPSKLGAFRLKRLSKLEASETCSHNFKVSLYSQKF